MGAGADITTIEGNVYARDGIDAWIGGFTIVDDDTAGIHCYDSSLTSANNVIRDQPHNGIHSSNCSLTARNNVLVGNGQNGILLIDSSQAAIENNIFGSNGSFGGVERLQPTVAERQRRLCTWIRSGGTRPVLQPAFPRRGRLSAAACLALHRRWQPEPPVQRP